MLGMELPDDECDDCIDLIAPLIIEWAQQEDALVVSRIKHSYNRTGNTFRVLQRVEDAIRAQFTPETHKPEDDVEEVPADAQ
jgi:hypothetical protein